MFYTVSISGITLYVVYGVYGDTVQNMKIEHSIVSSATKNPLSRGDEEVDQSDIPWQKNVLNSILHAHHWAVSNQSEVSIDTGVSPDTRTSAWTGMCCFNGLSA
ncbi:hypothetical protein N7501_011661 [Penicillium viridicatum]|nr:hypothetical protein N7501_011661 [Penicillium viridicatum]